MNATVIGRTSDGARSAIVLGAGIGGLTAAVALRRAGLDVTLCERAPELRAAGFGLSVQSNAMSALRTLGMGLDDELLRVGGRVTTFSFRAPDGSLLRRLEMTATDAATTAFVVDRRWNGGPEWNGLFLYDDGKFYDVYLPAGSLLLDLGGLNNKGQFVGLYAKQIGIDPFDGLPIYEHRGFLATPAPAKQSGEFVAQAGGKN